MRPDSTVSRYDLGGLESFEATAPRASPAFPPRTDKSPESDHTTNPVLSHWPLIPWSRGPLSAAVIEALQREPGSFVMPESIEVDDALIDDDFQLALYLCYDVHVRDLTGADWEWDVGLLAFRARLEHVFESRLREEAARRHQRARPDVAASLDQMIFASKGRSLSGYFNDRGTLDQFRELCVHRSAFHLQESDPHALAITRLSGEAKAALVELQYDQGSLNAQRSLSSLYAATMIALGLDASPGSYVEMLPGATLATVNLVSMFALRRRWSAALVGQLAVMEMTSAGPMERFGNALERFGIGPEGRRFYEVHRDIDARHANIARERMVTGLLSADPSLESEVLFGAAAVLLLEENFATHLLDAWEHNRSSLVPWESGL